MPSGAKKRKAAKRKKEKEQQQQLGAHPPDSPTSPTAGPPHPPQGNGEREEEDDLTSQEGKGTESGGEFPSPTGRGDSHCRVEVEAHEGQTESRVEDKGEGKGKKESDTTVMVDTVNVMENTENGGIEQPSESLAPQKAEDEVPKTSEAEAPVSVVEAQKDDVPPPPPLDPIPPPSAEVPISRVEEVAVELQSKKSEEVAVSGDGPPSIEHKHLDAVDTASPVELSVPITEEVVQASDVPAETLEVVESVAEVPSSKNEEKVVPLTDTTSEQPDLSVESHPHTETREIAGTTEVARPTLQQQRTSWLSCCGLFDVITGANR